MRFSFAAACMAGLAAAFIHPTLSLSAQDAESLQKADAPPNGVWVDSLDLTAATIRRPRPQRGQSSPQPIAIRLGGATYAHGVPAQSDGDVTIDLGGGAARFVSMVGIDDGAAPRELPPGTPPAPPPAPGSVVFGVWVDGRKAFESDVMHRGDAPKLVSVDLKGAKRLVLSVIDANDGTGGDSADWAGAAVIKASGAQAQPKVVAPQAAAPPTIAPSHSAAPMINYPRVTGATPGRPFMFRIPASGDGDLTFSDRKSVV